MAIVPDPSTNPTDTQNEDLASQFGANDWLFEEMYEQYVADPDSVDPRWADYFKTHEMAATSDAAPRAARRQRWHQQVR